MDARLDAREASCSSAAGVDDRRSDHRALHALLRGLSQELCEPLATLGTGFDHLLSEAPQPIAPEHEGHVATITGLCDDLRRLAGAYSEYAEVTRPGGPARRKTLTLGEIVADLDRRFSPRARDRGLIFEAAAAAADAEVVADAERCARIFDNLIDNAIAYTPSGGRVRVEAGLDGDSWVLTVEDDGPGIPVEAQAKVFEPFQRLNRDEHASVPGEGLGLSICRELADQLRGRIVLQSEADRGTRFSVVLPKRPSSDN